MKRGVAGRAFWSLGDQLVSSGSNFLAAVIAAHVLPITEFSGYAVVTTAFVLVIGLSRSVSSDPMLVRYSAAGESDARAASAAALGSAFSVGCAVGIAVALAGALADEVSAQALLVFAVLVPALLVQDCCRFCLQARGRSAAMAVNDMVWAALQFLGLAIAWRLDRLSLGTVLGTWGLGAAGAVLVGCAQLGVAPNPVRGAVGWWREHRDLNLRYAAEFVIGTGATSATILLVGVLLGADAVGALRAALVLFGPFNVFMLGVIVFAVPEVARIAHRGITGIFRISLLVTGLLVTAAVAWALVTLPFESVGEWLLGDAYDLARGVAVPVSVLFVASAAATGPQVAMRALGIARVTLRVRLRAFPGVVLGGIGGGLVAGAGGAAAGIAGGYVVAAGLWWWALAMTVARRDEALCAGSESGPAPEAVETATVPLA